MTSDDKSLAERLSAYREELIRLAVLGIPLALVNRGLAWVEGNLFGEPWEIVWFLVPMAVVAWMLWRSARKGDEFRLGGAFLGFLGVYILIFAAAANARMLDVRQPVFTNLEDQQPRSWLFPNWTGDWRYKVAPLQFSAVPELLLVTVPEPTRDRTLEELRFEIQRLVSLAQANDAVGIAFDFYLTGDSAIDALLCDTVESASLPVIMGYGVIWSQGIARETSLPEGLQGCFGADERRAHLVVYRDADHIVRSLPLDFLGRSGQPALSLRIVALLDPDGGEAAVRERLGGLQVVQFLPPANAAGRTGPYDSVTIGALEADVALMKDRFVLVGEASERDTLLTPYGARAGLALHADAVHSLRAGHLVRRTPWWASFGVIVVACYLLAALARRGVPALKMLAVTAAIGVTVVAMAALAMALWSTWVDVAYPLVAVGLLLPLLLMFRRQISGS